MNCFENFGNMYCINYGTNTFSLIQLHHLLDNVLTISGTIWFIYACTTLENTIIYYIRITKSRKA